MGYPYCPFVAWPFRAFVKNRLIKNRDFGLRIHCGENVPFANADAGAYRHFIAHMYIVFRCLRYLKRKSSVRIRIGHGIAFARILGDDISKLHHRKSLVLLAEIKNHAKHVLKNIAFEVNLTSNEYLLGQAMRGGNFQQTLKIDTLHHQVPIILSTDDDGVWPIDNCRSKHTGHHSLVAEYCRAISSFLIQNSNQLYWMLRNTQRFRFYSVYTALNLLQQQQNGTDDNPPEIQYEQDEEEEDYRQNERNEGDEDGGEEEENGEEEKRSQTVQSRAPKVFLDEDKNASTIVFHPDLIKTVLKKCYDHELTTGKFYTHFQGICDEEDIHTFEIQNDEKWKIRCNNLASIAFIAHCTRDRGRVPLDKDSRDEYVELFGTTPGVEPIEDAWTWVKDKFMFPADGDPNRHILHTNSNTNATFLSESPHGQQLQNLLGYLRDIRNPAGRIRVFASQAAQTQPELETITCADDMEVEVFTNNQKDTYSVSKIGAKRRRVDINKHPTKRTNMKGVDEQHALYVICEHASAATAYLHHIADTLAVYE